MTVTLEGVLIVLSIAVATATLVGIGVRLVLLPYIEDKLIDPINARLTQIEHQVTNDHKTNLRDDITDIKKALGIEDPH